MDWVSPGKRPSSFVITQHVTHRAYNCENVASRLPNVTQQLLVQHVHRQLVFMLSCNDQCHVYYTITWHVLDNFTV
jgi:hypothetical protein